MKRTAAYAVICAIMLAGCGAEKTVPVMPEEAVSGAAATESPTAFIPEPTEAETSAWQDPGEEESGAEAVSADEAEPEAPAEEAEGYSIETEYREDESLGKYMVISVSGRTPYVFAPDGAGSGHGSEISSVTQMLDDYGEENNIVLAINAGIFYDTNNKNVYCFNGKDPDGVLISDGVVLKSCEALDHSESEALVIDAEGGIGWTDYFADADALARGEGYYYDIHGDKVTGRPVVSAVTAFVPILVDGRIQYDPEDQDLHGFHNYVEHYTQRAPRQTFAVRDDGSCVIITNTTEWTLEQAAQAALKEGCVFAYNLDGGDSAEVAVADTTEGYRAENLYFIPGDNQIPVSIVFTEDDKPPVSAKPAGIEAVWDGETIPCGADDAEIAEHITVREELRNANGYVSERRLFTALTAEKESISHQLISGSADPAAARIRKTSVSPGGNLFYIKTAADGAMNIRMNNNTRLDGKYYDYSSGYTLTILDDRDTPGEKRAEIRYLTGYGKEELTALVTVRMEEE